MPAVLSSAGPAATVTTPDTAVIRFDQVWLAFDEKVILRDLSFELRPRRLKLILGASGAGKSTILRLILGLLRPDAGRIFVNGERTDRLSEAALMRVRSGLGMVFQEGALFDSLTVRENVGYRLYEESDAPIADVDRRVRDVLGYVGLEAFGERMPGELSGGQRRRVGIARALTARPGILLYDEPTTGLDPITALTIDDVIIRLRDIDGVSGIMVTHQLRDAFHIATSTAVLEDGQVAIRPAGGDRVSQTEFLVLREGQIAFEGTAAELRSTSDEYLRRFLS